MGSDSDIALLQKARQSKAAEARDVQARFEKTWKYADVRLDGSVL